MPPTPAQSRGGVLSFYLVSTKVAIVGSQLVLGHADTMSLVWFNVAGAVFTLALIPVALTRTPQPPPTAARPPGTREASTDWRRRRSSAASASGLLSSAVLGLTPLFGTRLGLPVPFIVWLLSAVQLGSFVCQWPIGRLSDRVDRRWVIAGCATAVALLSPLIAWPGPTSTGCCRCSSSTVPAASPSTRCRSPMAATSPSPTRWWA